MDFSRLVNYQSDFEVLLHVVDSEGTSVGYPSFDFTLLFYTSGTKRYECGQCGSIVRGVCDKSGDIQVVFNDHKMLPGTLNLEFRADIDNADFPDGKQRIVFTVPTGIELTSANGDALSAITVNVTLPFAVPASSSSE